MEIFATIYYILSFAECIPSIVKIIMTKSSRDYSLLGTSLLIIATTCWTIYIFFGIQQELIVYIGTAIDQVLTSLYTVVVFKYRNGKIKETELEIQQ